MVSTQDIAWAAGVYEGEGSVCPPTDKCRTQVVALTQKDSWLPYQLQGKFGGWVYYYTYAAKNGRPARSYYYWKCTGPVARGFLMTIYKFLSPRRQEQIRVALADNRARKRAA